MKENVVDIPKQRFRQLQDADIPTIDVSEFTWENWAVFANDLLPEQIEAIADAGMFTTGERTLPHPRAREPNSYHANKTFTYNGPLYNGLAHGEYEYVEDDVDTYKVLFFEDMLIKVKWTGRYGNFQVYTLGPEGTRMG